MKNPKIVYQDKKILVLDKPSGWIVNNAVTAKDQPVLEVWLPENFEYAISGNKRLRSGIVHRIDKETSGILLVAKEEDVFYQLQGQFKKREVNKTYLALVHGKILPGEGLVDVPLARLPWRRDRFGVVPGGKNATTKYKVVQYYSKDGEHFSLLECFPKTGRTHQVRIHLKHLGHPIVGDDFYAGRKTSRKDRVWCPRLFLHAASISFADPVSGEKHCFRSALPEELEKVISELEKEN